MNKYEAMKAAAQDEVSFRLHLLYALDDLQQVMKENAGVNAAILKYHLNEDDDYVTGEAFGMRSKLFFEDDNIEEV